MAGPGFSYVFLNFNTCCLSFFAGIRSCCSSLVDEWYYYCGDIYGNHSEKNYMGITDFAVNTELGYFASNSRLIQFTNQQCEVEEMSLLSAISVHYSEIALSGWAQVAEQALCMLLSKLRASC